MPACAIGGKAPGVGDEEVAKCGGWKKRSRTNFWQQSTLALMCFRPRLCCFRPAGELCVRYIPQYSQQNLGIVEHQCDKSQNHRNVATTISYVSPLPFIYSGSYQKYVFGPLRFPLEYSKVGVSHVTVYACDGPALQAPWQRGIRWLIVVIRSLRKQIHIDKAGVNYCSL